MNLPANEIHIWITQPEPIIDRELIHAYRALLDTAELTKQQRYRFAQDKHSALVTRALLRDRLAWYVGINPQDLRFSIGAKGKPWLPQFCDLQFNLSHTNNLIVLAVAQQHALGVDIEWLPRQSATLAIAHRFFSETETQALFALPTEQQRNRFFDYWTLKESYIKACGLGLAIPLRQFSFLLGTEDHQPIRNDITLTFAPEREDNPEHWCSWLVDLAQEHRLALSIKAAHGSPYTLRFFIGNPLTEFHECRPPLDFGKR
jgi:4'-phosphopantetheinyl transferase